MQAMRSEVSQFLAGIHPALEAEDRSKSPGMRGTATESSLFISSGPEPAASDREGPHRQALPGQLKSSAGLRFTARSSKPR